MAALTKTRLESALRSSIIQCFTSLGRRVASLGRGIDHIHCERWHNQVMSPFIVDSRKDFTIRLKRVESHFRRRRPRYPFDAVRAYVNLLGVDPADPDARLLEASRRLGWTVDSRPNTLNIWSAPRPMRPPDRIHVSVGRYFDAALHKGFRKTMVDNFNTKPLFQRELDKMIRGIDERVMTVLLRHENGLLVGGGLVATNAPGAFLFCGSVAKAYRGRGLWNVLVAARQMISAAQGARFWITTTRTKAILGKGDLSIPLTTLFKEI